MDDSTDTLPPVTPRASLVLEYQRREAAVQARALAKYGERGGDPGGREDFDAVDYAINELVGLPRYAQMIQHRLAARGVATAATTRMLTGMAEQARAWAIALIELDQSLRDRMIHLGAREHDVPPGS